jgi:hypothetical protein
MYKRKNRAEYGANSLGDFESNVINSRFAIGAIDGVTRSHPVNTTHSIFQLF